MLARLFVPLASLGVFAAFAAVYFTNHADYMRLLCDYGFGPAPQPFFDTNLMLASVVHAKAGGASFVDHIVTLYSPFWLLGEYLPVTMAWRYPIGLLQDVLFFASLAFLPPPRDWQEQAVRLIGVLSPVCAFALERSNAELLVFILMVAVGLLYPGNGRSRFLAYVLLLLATLLKLYPAITVLATLRERRRTSIALMAGFGLFVVGFVLIFLREMRNILSNLPSASIFANAFAARDLPDAAKDLFLQEFGQSAAIATFIRLAVFLSLLAVTGWTSWKLGSNRAFRGAFTDLPEPGRSLLLLSALLIVGCFFAGQSGYYRAIFLVLALPGLNWLRKNTVGGEWVHQLLGRSAGYIMVLLWSEMVRQGIYTHAVQIAGLYPAAAERWIVAYFAIWTLRELAWWWVISLLAGVLTAFALDCPALRRHPTPAT